MILGKTAIDCATDGLVVFRDTVMPAIFPFAFAIIQAGIRRIIVSGLQVRIPSFYLQGVNELVDGTEFGQRRVGGTDSPL